MKRLREIHSAKISEVNVFQLLNNRNRSILSIRLFVSVIDTLSYFSLQIQSGHRHLRSRKLYALKMYPESSMFFPSVGLNNFQSSVVYFPFHFTNNVAILLRR